MVKTLARLICREEMLVEKGCISFERVWFESRRQDRVAVCRTDSRGTVSIDAYATGRRTVQVKPQ